MATGDCASVSHLSTAYCASRSAFSIKNILNLQEDTTAQQKECSSRSGKADTFFSSSFPLVPRAVRASFPNLSTWYPDFEISFGGVPYLESVPQVNELPFPSYGSSFGVGMLQRKRRRPLRKKKQRPLFSTNQIQTMENEFTKCRYVTESRRAELAVDLNLTETQVKTWFQNRRTKWKKERREKSELPPPDAQNHCEEAISHALPEGDFSYYNQQFHLYPMAWNAPNSSNIPSLKSVFSW